MSNVNLIVTIVPKGWGDTVMHAAVKAGASGGTVFFGRGTGVNETQRLFGVLIEPEKEIVLTLTTPDKNEAILAGIVAAGKLDERGHGLAFVVPVDKIAGASAHAVHDMTKAG